MTAMWTHTMSYLQLNFALSEMFLKTKNRPGNEFYFDQLTSLFSDVAAAGHSGQTRPQGILFCCVFTVSIYYFMVGSHVISTSVVQSSWRWFIYQQWPLRHTLSLTYWLFNHLRTRPIFRNFAWNCIPKLNQLYLQNYRAQMHNLVVYA